MNRREPHVTRDVDNGPAPGRVGMKRRGARAMRILFNVLWHIPCLGFLTAILAWLVGLVLTATVVGSPVGLGLMEYAKFLFAPFTRRMLRREDVVGTYTSKTWRVWSTLVLVVYFPVGVALLVLGVMQVLLIVVTFTLTIVGIIFGLTGAHVLANSLITLWSGPLGPDSFMRRI